MGIFMMLRRDLVSRPLFTQHLVSLLFPVVQPPLLINGKGLQCLAEIFQTAEQGLVSSICSLPLQGNVEADSTSCVKFSFADVHISKARRANYKNIKQYFHESVSSFRSCWNMFICLDYIKVINPFFKRLMCVTIAYHSSDSLFRLKIAQ